MQKQAEIKAGDFSPWKIFFWEALLFSLTLFLGIANASKITGLLRAQEVPVAPVDFAQLILSFFLATVFILALIFFVKSKPKKGVIFKALFVFLIFFGGIVTLELWLGSFLALILMGVLIVLWLKKSSVLVHNISIIFGISGVGASLGLRIDPTTMVFLLIAFSVYDFLAVYKTKHMVKMAKEMVEHQAILALVIPRSISGFGGKLGEIKTGGKFLILGGGDIALPLLFCASLTHQGFLNSALVVGAFSLVGLFLSFFIFTNQKVRRPIPALPPITLFSILGYLITLIIW